MKSKTFDFKRFANMFRWYLVVNKKNTILIIICTILISMSTGIAMCWNEYPNTNTIYTMIFFLMTAIASSMMFNILNNKAVSQLFLALPASRTEKRLATLMTVMFWIITIYPAQYIGDVMRALFQAAYQNKEFTIIIKPFTYSNPDLPSDYATLVKIIMVLYLFAINIVYAVSSATMLRNSIMAFCYGTAICFGFYIQLFKAIEALHDVKDIFGISCENGYHFSTGGYFAIGFIILGYACYFFNKKSITLNNYVLDEKK